MSESSWAKFIAFLGTAFNKGVLDTTINLGKPGDGPGHQKKIRILEILSIIGTGLVVIFLIVTCTMTWPCKSKRKRRQEEMENTEEALSKSDCPICAVTMPAPTYLPPIIDTSRLSINFDAITPLDEDSATMAHAPPTRLQRPTECSSNRRDFIEPRRHQT
ncbi:hypothetical protein PVAG01_08871 [Phlyctema vagabunda]|uniref:Uncharacterized protein n=1 Tax=Phlyctema vagabunda TaxID=108571 RepID=A0ABR4PAR6_9HELO